jgi:uncharacterized protein
VAGVDTPSPAGGPGGDVRARLRLALRDALKAQDAAAVSALRSVLSAIGNAEAVTREDTAAAGASSAHIAGTVAGLGAGEADRRVLSPADVARILRAEVGERLAAADAYERAGQQARAGQLRDEVEALRGALAPGSGHGQWPG